MSWTARTARRGVQVNHKVAERLVGAARAALTTAEAGVARQVLAADLALLADLDVQICAAQARIAELLPDTEYAVLTSVPGRGSVRVGGYAAALGAISRWPAAANEGVHGSPVEPDAAAIAAAGGSRVGVAELVLDVLQPHAGVAGEGVTGVAQHLRRHLDLDAGGTAEAAEQPPDRGAVASRTGADGRFDGLE
jgi:hypothetical protein